MTKLSSSRSTGFTVLTVLTGALAVGLSVDAVIKPSGASSESIEYSDCLWYVARNHGFYQVQRKVASGQADTQNRQLWEQFVHSIGIDECGPIKVDLVDLTQAIAMTVDQADQYFLSPCCSRFYTR